MKTALIGYSGFVGCNLTHQLRFDCIYNSKNFTEMVDGHYDTVVCAGISANMQLANNNPEADLRDIEKLLHVFKSIKVRNFILISTIAVYAQPAINVYEDSAQLETKVPYGRNRCYAEKVVTELFDRYLIIRLPALFGRGLKKNFIYDMQHPEPAFITREKFAELEAAGNFNDKTALRSCYMLDANGVFRLRCNLPNNELSIIRDVLTRLGYTSLQFTHCDSQFQLYDLNNLWKDISIALHNDLKLLNLVTEPITAQEISKKVFNLNFTNKTSTPPYTYDIKSKYASLYGKKDGYLYSKEEIVEQLRQFVALKDKKNG